MDKLLLVLSAMSFVILVAMMFMISPSEAGPLGILGFFLLCYVLFLGLAVLGCRLFFRLRSKIDKTKAGNEVKKSYYYGAVSALLPLLAILVDLPGDPAIWKIPVILGVEVALWMLVSRFIV